MKRYLQSLPPDVRRDFQAKAKAYRYGKNSKAAAGLARKDTGTRHVKVHAPAGVKVA